MSFGKRQLLAALAALLLVSSFADPVRAQGENITPSLRRTPLMLEPGISTFRIVPPPENQLLMQQGVVAAQASVIVNYLAAGQGPVEDGCTTWPVQAQTAFSYAANLWAAQLQSPVPITIDACWGTLGPNTLGHAGTNHIDRDFPNAPIANTWFPIALANALSGTDRVPGSADIYAAFSSTFSWYFGTDGIPGGQVDFVTVVLHEIGHGLGFLGSMNVAGGLGSWGFGSGFPLVYDRFTENGSNQALLNTSLFPNSSVALASQLQSNSVFFDGTNTRSANGNAPAPLYAPGTWSGGSSYSHLAESFNNTIDGLMTYSLPSGEAIHQLGPVVLGILQDSGWLIASASPGSLSLNLTNTASSFPVTTGSTIFSVNRTGGALGAVTGNLGVTGGCSLSASSVSFADGSTSPSPANVTVSAGSATGGATCTITLAAEAPATTGSPSTHNISVFIPDSVPDAFGFTSQNGVVPETVITSNTITPVGFNVPTAISVANGTYSIGCAGGGFTSAPGTINPGQTVCVQHTASPGFSSTVTTTLTIGGVDGTFSSTTVASLGTALANGVAVNNLSGASGSSTYFYIDVPAYATSLNVNTTGSGRSIDLNLYVRRDGVPTTLVRDCASAALGTAVESCAFTNPPAGRYYILLFGAPPSGYTGVSLTATFVVVVPDAVPDAFSFTSQTDVPVSSVRTSNTITPAGYNTTANISVANGEYSIGCTATFVSTPGTINPAQTVCVRHTSSASNSSTVTTTLTIGGVNGTFSSTTVAPPNPGTLSLNLAGTAASIPVTSGSTTLAVARTAGTSGAVSGNLGVTGGCTLSAASVSFADASSTPSPATVTVSAGTAGAGDTCTVTLTAVGPATTGSPNSTSISVVSPPAVGTPLTNGVAVTGLAGAAGSSTFFYIDVPASASSLVVQTSGGTSGRTGTSNVNLYVRRDAVPTTGAFDCASTGTASTEACSFTSPPAGRYYVLLYGASEFASVNLVATFVVSVPSPGTLALSTASASIPVTTGSAVFSVLRTGGTVGAATGNLGVTGGCTLSAPSVSFADGSSTPSPATVTVSAGTATGGSTCSVTLTASGASLGSPSTLTVSVTSTPPPSGTPLVNGVAVTGLAGAAGSSTIFYIDVPSGASSLVVQTSGGTSGRTGTSNVNLYVRRDAVPTTGTFDCASTGTASTEACSFTSPAAGRYFVLLYGASEFASVNLVATFVVSVPSPGTLALNLSGTATSMKITTGSTNFAVARSGGTLGAVSANLGVTGGCTLSSPSVSFADGSSTPSPSMVTVSAGSAVAGATCTVTMTAVGATTGSPSTFNIAMTSGR
jgi:hypothetical protein